MINLSTNIRAFRKERKLTQEQLAEVLGVTLGAVSKWELGASIPDLTLIIEMADFFETSVDSLLGYTWYSGSINQTIEQIRHLRNEKRFDEASIEAEKALQKHPNNFDIAYQSAIQYMLKGVEYSCQKASRRALELFERALELIGQNKDKSINEWTLKNHIADVYVFLGKYEEAIERMKDNNIEGLNNGHIGFTIATALHQPEDALGYLSDALIDHVMRIFRLVTGYANAYSEMKDYDSAMKILLWSRDLLNGLSLPGINSYLDKADAQLLTACAVVAAQDQAMDQARHYLMQAVRAARRFDAQPDYGFSGIRFYHSSKPHTAFDSFGKTTMEGIHRMISEHEAEKDSLLEIMDDLTNSKAIIKESSS